MLVMYVCIICIDVGRVFVGYLYRCWSCICGLQVSMLVMYLWVIGIDVFHVFLGYRYRCWSCISGL
jgi:hypothetical protein